MRCRAGGASVAEDENGLAFRPCIVKKIGQAGHLRGVDAPESPVSFGTPLLNVGASAPAYLVAAKRARSQPSGDGAGGAVLAAALEKLAPKDPKGPGKRP